VTATMTTTDWQARLGERAAVSLAELDRRAALMVRRDRKYLVPETDLDWLVASLPAATRVLEIDGRRDFDYTSVYFDTPDRTSYFLTAQGRRRRYKLRTRRYGADTPAWLEVKTRGPRGITVKDRLGALEGPAETRPGGGLWAEALATVGYRGCQPPALADLRLALESRYHRTTLLLPGGSRTTIDTQLTWSAPDGDAWLADGWAIVETKSLGPATPVDRAAWAAGLRPRPLSKFGVGLALTHPGLPAHRWHRLIQTLEGGMN